MNLRKFRLILSFACLLGVSLTTTFSSAETTTPPGRNQQLLANYGKLPIVFEPDEGKGPAQFISRGSGYTLYLTADEAVIALAKPASPASLKTGAHTAPSTKGGFVALRMKIIGADSKAAVHGVDEMPGKANYLIGNDPTKWHTNVPTFAKVEYKNVYPGISLIYRGDRRQLEYDFVVNPGAQPDNIALQFQGADKMEVEPGGDLVIQLAGKVIRQPRPVVYQEIRGVRQLISGRYAIYNKNCVRFRLAPYDRRSPVIMMRCLKPPPQQTAAF